MRTGVNWEVWIDQETTLQSMCTSRLDFTDKGGLAED
jgi:hypothetical protein